MISFYIKTTGYQTHARYTVLYVNEIYTLPNMNTHNFAIFQLSCVILIYALVIQTLGHNSLGYATAEMRINASFSYWTNEEKEAEKNVEEDCRMKGMRRIEIGK